MLYVNSRESVDYFYMVHGIGCVPPEVGIGPPELHLRWPKTTSPDAFVNVQVPYVSKVPDVNDRKLPKRFYLSESGALLSRLPEKGPGRASYAAAFTQAEREQRKRWYEEAALLNRCLTALFTKLNTKEPVRTIITLAYHIVLHHTHDLPGSLKRVPCMRWLLMVQSMQPVLGSFTVQDDIRYIEIELLAFEAKWPEYADLLAFFRPALLRRVARFKRLASTPPSSLENPVETREKFTC